MKSRSLATFLLSSFLLLPINLIPKAEANLLGDNVEAEFLFPNVSSLTPSFNPSSNPFKIKTGLIVSIGPSSHIPYYFTLSYSSTALSETLTYTFEVGTATVFFSSTDFNGPSLADLSGAHFGTVTSVSGLPAADVSSTGTTVSANFAGQHFTTGDSVSITFAPVSDPSAVPLPAALPLFGSALMGLAWFGNRTAAAKRGRTTPVA